MTSDFPKVSVITPVWNLDEYLNETIRSVSEQSLQEWELVIVDDQSTDRSADIAEKWSKRDSRIRSVVRQSAVKGASACRNQGFAASRGRFILFLDGDDVLSSDCLEQRLSAMAKNPDTDFGVFPCHRFLSEPGDSVERCGEQAKEDDLRNALRGKLPFQTSAVLWRRESYEHLGGWCEDLNSWQDWHIHTKALLRRLHYRRYENCGEYYYRLRPGSLSTQRFLC